MTYITLLWICSKEFRFILWLFSSGNSLAVLSLISSASQFYVWFFNLVSADLLKTCICMPYTLYLIW